MATLTKLFTDTNQTGHLRPFDVRRDLNQVADLIEICFSDTLDTDGQRYLQQMRSAALSPGYLRWLSLATDRTTLPMNGFVWEEDNRLVGNLTLIPAFNPRYRYWLIANVAVHPDYRRRGIARNLTLKAVEYTRQHGAQTTWLHVREENEAAISLYQAIGFKEQARRTSWVSSNNSGLDPALNPDISTRMSMPSGVGIGRRSARDWPEQKAWLEQLYPQSVNWHLPIRLNALRPGMAGGFYRFWNDIHVQQWSAWRGHHLLGVLAWQLQPGYSDALWLAVDSEHAEDAIGALLMYGRRQLSLQRPLSLDFPARQAVGALESAGFQAHQTLVWMSLDPR